MTEPDNNNPFQTNPVAATTDPAAAPDYRPAVRMIDQSAAHIFAGAGPFAAISGMLLLGVSALIGWSAYQGGPFHAASLRFGSGSLLGGLMAIPALLMLLFALSAWKLRKSREEDDLLKALIWQRSALAAVCGCVLVAAAIFFFLVMMSVHFAMWQ